jgi:1-deoxy-D-xylulose-5-phosphate synthase
VTNELIPYSLLTQINDPRDLRRLTEAELPVLAQELRQYLIEVIGTHGGHFAANLGTVELTIALHYVFDTPQDRLVWDVGHQTYPHKILTGRRERLASIRRADGIAPFPSREESPYDTFGVGHSSTSISAALGMALAAQAQNQSRRVAAIIGDGAMTAGLAYEALSHAGHVRADMLVILNDNEMSISRNVGGLSNYLARLLSSPLYTSLREGGKKVLQTLPPVHELAKRTEEHVKGMVVPGTLFEELGFNYLGPIDGHDLDVLVKTLRNLRDTAGPQFLHVITRKGKGYPLAEADPIKYHGITRLDPTTGALVVSASPKPTYSQIFGRWLCHSAEQNPKLIAITPAMSEGSGMTEFERRFPSRYFDVGICEQHAVTLAAGLACEGMHPVVAIYSTFLQRAYDQVIHDVTLQNLPVLFAIDRAGPVGQDGATHQGAFDISYLRCLPNMVVMTPSDEDECWRMLNLGLQLTGPAAVRYPRGTGTGVEIRAQAEPPVLGKAEIKRQGKEIAVLAFGPLLALALAVAQKYPVTVVDMRFVKPLDEALVLELARTHQHLITIEENAVAGGAGSAVMECLAAHGVTIPVTQLGIPDHYLPHGSREEQLAACGLDAPHLQQVVEQILGPIRRQQRG